MKRGIIIPIVLACVSAGVARGQVTDSQSISGTVTDATGASVPGASVTVTNEATKISVTVKTNGDGLYNALNLPVGTYTISTTMDGFKKSVVTGVALDVGAKPAVPVQLQVGGVGESVEVKAESVMIQTTTAEIGGVVTSTEATQIQLNGRNYIQLITLQPGVSQTVASGFAISGTYGVNGNSQSVNGIRTDSMNFFIDGVDNKDNGGGGNNFVNISPDSLQQFRNVASAYDASYGGSSGATVSVAIKSGGQSFHGNAYEYIRNDAIQAYPFRALSSYSVAPVKAPLRYNDFGWTLGGPIYIPGHFNASKEKLFFFAGQEYKRLRTSTVQNVTVPTPAAIAAAIATGPSTATGRAIAASVLQDPSGNFRYLSLGNNDQSEWLIKIDYHMNDKNQFSGSYVHDNVKVVGNPTNFVIYDRLIPGLTSNARWIHTFNSKMVNTAVGSFSGNIINEGVNIRPNPQFGKSVQRADYGMTYATLYNASTYIPQTTISGYGNPGTTPRQFDNYQRIYALKDDLSIVVGNHSMKTGAYFWRARKNQTAPPQLNGAFTFSNLAGLVAGNFASYTEGSNIPQIQARFTQFETYFQDDWTLSRRLTLNMGLRWQYMPPISSWPNNTAFFDPNFYDPTKAATVSGSTGLITNNPSPYNGLVLPGTGFSDKAKQVVAPSVYNNPQVTALFHNLPGGIINTVYNTFAPRVGFAYDLTGKQDTVIRGGYGMSYERVEGNYIYGAASQLPFVAVANLASAGNADSLGSIGTSAAPQNIGNSGDRNLNPPRIHNFSIGVQHKLFNNTSIEMNYVGSRSTSLTWVKDLNQGAAGTEQANPGVARNALRPYKGYGEIYQYTNGSHSNYNSLQARWQTRFNKGGLVGLAFTWSQCLANGSGYNYSPQDSTSLAADYGPCNFNQPKIFVASYVYPLPFWQHEQDWYKKALGGWQVSGITRIANGLPINIIQPSGLSVAGNLVTTASVAQRPNLVPGANPYAHNGKQYLNYAAFVQPAAGTYGNVHYDGILGPLFNNWDVALQKNIPIHESIGAEFRAEMFNAPNHLSPFGVGATLGSVQPNGTYQPNYSATGTYQNSFGQITSTADPRTMEFVLRINF
ncbi:carboxypeptidase regulatory-like domain-containing protein [Terriglobus roseus]|uniref:TonB-dependent Receptor Plug Domain n=1 Tax=Terriglobus roseus TaxID=392734 RepID=A0A1G7H263_9BACT|nr:carboxypeptidase regulatory-like domain-containing protein [Terriglobus roseus]SDE94404.1 TonB-dependent Receptor Plug Domain [Terriglobus roseus]